MAGITTYLSILRLNVNELISSFKRHRFANWIKKEDLTICYLKKPNLLTEINTIKGRRRLTKLWPLKIGRSNNTYIR
jgi:hypothetical protein